MSFGSYSTTPANNLSCSGINIAEGCPAGNTNDALRQIMADGKELFDTVSGISVSSYMPIAGGAFTGPITRSGAGGFLYHAGSAQSGGIIYTQLSTAALPTSPAEGTIVFLY
jgi:hypothetical protein